MNKKYQTKEFLNGDLYNLYKEKYCNNSYDFSGFRQYRKSIFSQNGEDGILEQIFNEIGWENKTCVEFGCLKNNELSNTKYLANKYNLKQIKFDSENEDKNKNIYNEFITAENINDVFDKYKVPINVDLLSIDIDGNDFWVWKTLQYLPSVIIIENNHLINCTLNRVIEYNPNFRFNGSCYFGASILSLLKLAMEKQYSLICQESFNSIFINNNKLDLLKTNVRNINNVNAFYQPGSCFYFQEDKNGVWIEY